MFAQGLITFAFVALLGWLLWRHVAAPLLDGVAPGPEAPRPTRAEALEQKRRERAQLEEEIGLAQEIQKLEPRLERMRERLERIEEWPAAAAKQRRSAPGEEE